jgi:hypothetical protein
MFNCHVRRQLYMFWLFLVRPACMLIVGSAVVDLSPAVPITMLCCIIATYCLVLVTVLPACRCCAAERSWSMR